MNITRIIFLSVGLFLASVLPLLAAPVDLNPYGSVWTDRQAVTASAVALASHAAGEICVKAMTTNAITVYVGKSDVTTSTGFELTPGEGACFRLLNSNLLYVIASTTGASVTYYGTN